MTRAWLLILGAGAGLAGVLAVELLPASAEVGTPAPIQVVTPPGARSPAEAPPLADWADVARARPLFAPDRRPAVSAQGPASHDSLPRLAGTIRSDDNLLAIFEPGGDARPIVVGRDAIVAGWTVVDIADAMVTLVRAGRATTLRLGYANLPVAAKPVEEGPAVMVVLHSKRTDPFLQP